MTPPYRSFMVPVDGGELFVGAWEADTDLPVVIGVHGITANHLEFPYLAEALAGDARLIAPDLRGRAGSSSLPGPFGMKAHAGDLVRVLDHLGVEKATLAGHSMGAYVSAVFARYHADRLAGHVMIDGGVNLDVAFDENTDIEAITLSILGPTMQRLSMTFTDVDAWLAFWKAHPALEEWDEVIEAYVMRDLVGHPPELRSSANRDAVLEDSKDNLAGEGAVGFKSLPGPTPWVRAPRGLLNADPLYSDEVAEERARSFPNLVPMLVPDVNHFTIVISRKGAAAVAEIIRSQLPG